MNESFPERKRVEDKDLAEDMAIASDAYHTEETAWLKKSKEASIQPPVSFWDKISSIIGISLSERTREDVRIGSEATAAMFAKTAEVTEDAIEYSALTQKEAENMDVVSLTKLIQKTQDEISAQKPDMANPESAKIYWKLGGLLKAGLQILQNKNLTDLEIEELRKIYFKS